MLFFIRIYFILLQHRKWKNVLGLWMFKTDNYILYVCIKNLYKMQILIPRKRAMLIWQGIQLNSEDAK